MIFTTNRVTVEFLQALSLERMFGSNVVKEETLQKRLEEFLLQQQVQENSDKHGSFSEQHTQEVSRTKKIVLGAYIYN